MAAQIDDLVRMRDIETLFGLMDNDDDWMMQLDAAEGLLRLGERGGLDFLYSATQSESREVRDYAREILDARHRLNSILAKHTGQTIDRIKTDTDRDNFMTGEQATAYGLIDAVLQQRGETGTATRT